MNNYIALTDTHAHIPSACESRKKEGEKLLPILDEVYRHSDAYIIDIGTEYNDFPSRLDMLGSYPFIKFSVGIFPDEDSCQNVSARMPVLESHVLKRQCVAIGECGIDFYYGMDYAKEQIELFSAQIELALKYNLPLIVHSRDAFKETLDTLRPAMGKIPVIIHCFSYGRLEAEEFVKCGFYVSFAGKITYKKNEDLVEACSIIPDSKLLIETDSPYMCPMPFRYRSCSSLDIVRTYDFIATIRNTNLQKLSYSVNLNSKEAFRL